MKNIINNIKVMCLALFGFSFRESRAIIDPLTGTLTCLAFGSSATAQAAVCNYAWSLLALIGGCTVYTVVRECYPQCINLLPGLVR